MSGKDPLYKYKPFGTEEVPAPAPGEDSRTCADGCLVDECWHWMQCGASACISCDYSREWKDDDFSRRDQNR